MAFGIQPHHTISYQIENQSSRQFYALAVAAAKQLGWDVSYLSESGFKASNKNLTGSRFEFITVKLEGIEALMLSQTGANQMTDWGKNKKNLEKLIAKIEELKASLTADELDKKYEELKQQFISKEGDILLNWHPSHDANMKGFLSLFKPREGFFVTPLIIDINIIVFLAMVISGVNFLLPDNQSLLNWGANFSPLTLDGQWWRLFSCMFLHIGIFHILLNMYALLYIGLLLEPYLGRLRFASAYLLTGIASSAASLWWHSNIISAGASGAIFGMYGVFLAMLTTNIIDKTKRKPLLTSIAIFVVYNLMNGMKGGIDNAAHIGGLLSGLVAGYAFLPSLKKPEETMLKYLAIGLLCVLVFGVSYAAMKKAPDSLSQYEQIMNQYSANEKEALIVYSHFSSPQDTLYSELKNGIQLWNKNEKLLDSVGKLDLPENLNGIVRTLKRYNDLRSRSYVEMMYLVTVKNDQAATDTLREFNIKIQSILDSLKSK